MLITCSQLSSTISISRSPIASVRRLGSGHARAAAIGGADSCGIADGRELHEATAELQVGGRDPGHLQGEARLPTPPGPTSVMNRSSTNRCMRSRSSASRPTNGVSASGMAECGAAFLSRFAIVGTVERSVLGQDRCLQRAQLVAGFEPELLAEDMTAVLEDPQGIGLSTRAVQREHQESAQPFSKRICGDELVELGDGALVTTELELDVEPFLDQREAQFRQPGDGSRREVVVGEVGEGIAPPERIGLGQQRGSLAQITFDDGRTRRGDELFVAKDVDRFDWKLERVPITTHGDEVGRAQRPPQLRCEPLQTVAHRRRWIHTPQHVDELVGGNHPARLEREHREKGTQLRSRNDHVSAVVVDHLESTQQPDAHGVHRTRHGAPSARGQHHVSPSAHTDLMTRPTIRSRNQHTLALAEKRSSARLRR